MRPSRSLQSGAFRFALAMALVFAVGAMGLLVVVKHAIDNYTADAVEDGVSSEIAILLGEERQMGRRELVNAIGRHQAAVRERQLRYLLVARDNTVLAGLLPASLGLTGWHEWRLREPCRRKTCMTPLLANGVTLGDGATLVVASDTTDLVRLRRDLSRFTIGFGLSIATFVLLGGLATGRLFLRRLDGVNAAINRIVAGRFAERLPGIGMGPEFDQLTANLNGMLARIELLMDGLRQVSVDVAHDLRTPLSRLRQRLERLLGQAPADLGDEIEGALAQTDQILGIFAALLRIGAMESGAAREHFRLVDLSDLLRRIAAAYAPEVEDAGRAFSTELPPNLLVEGDAELLGQAVTNLLENALAHTPARTPIRLEVSVQGGMARIVVEDEGPGVPMEERELVKRRFYRLDRSRTATGAGLGLPLVAAIAALHDGVLQLEDARPGLRAVIALPVH